jgi:gliding motility-associated-like protein
LQVTADDGAGGLCPGIGNTTVTVDAPATPDFTQSDPCEDQITLVATPSGPYTYRWFRNNVLIPGGGGQQITAGIPDNGSQYRVDVVNTITGCVYGSPSKAANIAGDVRVSILATTPCEGSPFTLTAVPNPPTISTFTWTLDGTQLTPTSSVLTETRGGDYVVSVTQSNCTVTDEMNVVLGPVTPGLLPDRDIICPDSPDEDENQVILRAAPNLLSYTWFKEGVALNNTADSLIAVEPGNYSVDMINSYGCASSDETLLVEECDPRITGPNAFRPGGLNKEFFVYTFFIDDTDFQIFIFNRWGEMVFQSNERNFKWNGGYNNNAGEPLPPGTYTYVIKYKSSYREEDGIQEKRGGVVLLR